MTMTLLPNNDYQNFKSNILHLQDSREHKIKKSLGVYDAYKYIRKNKWFDIGRKLTEHEFYSIIRKVNSMLANNLCSGNPVVFPNRMGQLELRKRKSLPIIDNKGKLKVTYAIDWDKTLKLWYEDKEAYENKTLVKMPEKNIFRVKYSKVTATYNNKSFMDFQVNRRIKKLLKDNIKNNLIDAYNLW